MSDKKTDGGGKRTVLVVDDEEDVCELVEFQLEKEGFRVEWVTNPLEAIGLARDLEPDLVILDVMMPDLDGFRLCSMLKVDSRLKHVPTLFLSAKDEVEDRVKGFARGADDYISKPFDRRELVARVKAVMARSQKHKEALGGKLRAGGIALDPERHTVEINGDEVKLTATEFRLLHLLMERKGRVQNRENLLINVWNYDTDLETRTVDNHVGRLRSKLGEDGDMIETVRGVGYRLAEKG